MVDLEQSGPIDYVVVEFPPGGLRGDAFPLLTDLVDRGVIRVLDLTVVGRDAEGAFAVLDVEELSARGVDLTLFHGVTHDVLDDDDLRDVARRVLPGYSVAVLLFENVWAAPLATTLRHNGAQLLDSRRFPVQAILAKLDSMAGAAPPAALGDAPA
ncbi:DUF6325 family protein [Cellulomonas algicola]|uniref:DUF1269 domain-containing family protein n=1 Tax=Cellulomonas algicola TaxID=2071633 RepID=A0A401V5C3_9CELL|nr:DUF6325 family protein [Cellulomonas algicola]GCD22118.1 hypothetical protein CTKZ_36800 [Cellulomonas algicola]